jgi:lysyl-tRNA synthetase class 2
MDLTEQLITGLVQKVCGATSIQYGEHNVDFAKWQRLSMREAICEYWPAELAPVPAISELAAAGGAAAAVKCYNSWAEAKGFEPGHIPTSATDGFCTALLFELVAEDKLIQPSIIYDFPTDISPLSKQRDDDPSLVERFEFFAGGLELGNGFSELNDPEEQERRFREQIARGGEEVPKELDVDYIRALCHGLPPTAGEGIGIDRLTMLLTDSHSIRDVILFPLMRPEAPAAPATPPGEEKK